MTFQPGLVEMFEKHARKGRLVYVAGKLQTRRWKKDGEDSDRFSTEIILVPGGRVQFLDKGTGSNGNAEPAMTAAAETPMNDTRRHPVLTRPYVANVKLVGLTPCGLSFFAIS